MTNYEIEARARKASAIAEHVEAWHGGRCTHDELIAGLANMDDDGWADVAKAAGQRYPSIATRSTVLALLGSLPCVHDHAAKAAKAAAALERL